MQELLNLILVKSLPAGTDFKIEESKDDNGDVVYTIDIPEEFKGKIIGRNGNNINAIRTLLSVVARNQGVRVNISIKD